MVRLVHQERKGKDMGLYGFNTPDFMSSDLCTAEVAELEGWDYSEVADFTITNVVEIIELQEEW